MKNKMFCIKRSLFLCQLLRWQSYLFFIFHSSFFIKKLFYD